MQSEIDGLLDRDEQSRDQQSHVVLLERVLDGLHAIETAQSADERQAAIDELPESTGEDAQLDRLLHELRDTSIYVQDLGMTVRLAIGRIEYIKRLVAPTQKQRELPVLFGWPLPPPEERPAESGPRDDPAGG
jgi:hypothetical protein